jgi:hypothetical protein
MSVKLLLNCSGCEATAEGNLTRRFEGIFGGEHGFGSWHLEPHVPAGWTLFDPYTNVTYCPTCSEEIWGPTVNQDAMVGATL